MFNSTSEDTPGLFSGFNGLMIKTAGRQLGKAALKASRTAGRIVLAVIPFRATLILLLAITLVLTLNLLYFYTIMDEVESFFAGMGDGIKQLVDTPKSLFSYIRNAVNSLIDKISGTSDSNPFIHVDPKLIKECLKIESSSIDEDNKIKKVKAKVVTKVTTITQEGDYQPVTGVATKVDYTDYELNVYDVKYPYRLWWQLPASISIYLDMRDNETEELMNKIRSYLMPEFVWVKDDEYTKDVTEYTEKVTEMYKTVKSNGPDMIVKTGSTTTITEKTTYYPLPALNTAITAFKTYKFYYTPDVVKKDELSNYETTIQYSPSESGSFSIIKARTGTKIVEDTLSNTVREINTGFLRFINDVPMSINDLNMSYMLAEVMPGSTEYLNNVSEFIDWYNGISYNYWDLSSIVYDSDISNINTIGGLSARYESRGNPSAIADNPGDPGGKSYGIWQLASRKGSVDRFLSWLKSANTSFYSQLTDARELDGGAFGNSFDACWKRLGIEDKDEFTKLQETFIKMSYYDIAAGALKAEFDFDIETRSLALKNVLFSTAVQHGVGGAITLLKRVNETRNLKSSSDEQIINALYDERSKVEIYFSNCSTQVRHNVYLRFMMERADALALLKKP